MTIVRRIKNRLVGSGRGDCNISCVARRSPEWSRVELRGAYLETTNYGPYLGDRPAQ